MKMKRSPVLLACMLALASTSASADYWARTWNSLEGYTVPATIVQGDDVWLGVYGQWPTEISCVPDVCAVNVAGTEIVLDLYDAYAQASSSSGEVSDCDLGDYAVAPDGGKLAPGWYNLYVAQYSNLWPQPAEEYSYVRGDEWLATFAVYLLGDINHDGSVDVADLLLLADAFGHCEGEAEYNPDADLNKDLCVDVSDILILATNWGRSI